MNDKLDDLSTQIDDAVLSSEELEQKPGDLPPEKIGKMKEALKEAQDVAEDLENDED